MPSPTNSFIDSAIGSLDNTDVKNGAKPSIKLFGATAGSTKHLNISMPQLRAIETILRMDDSGDEASQAQQEALGTAMAELLNLKKGRDGFFDTRGGTKTPRGLGATMMRLFSEVNS